MTQPLLPLYLGPWWHRAALEIPGILGIHYTEACEKTGDFTYGAPALDLKALHPYSLTFLTKPEERRKKQRETGGGGEEEKSPPPKKKKQKALASAVASGFPPALHSTRPAESERGVRPFCLPASNRHLKKGDAVREASPTPVTLNQKKKREREKTWSGKAVKSLPSTPHPSPTLPLPPLHP